MNDNNVRELLLQILTLKIFYYITHKKKGRTTRLHSYTIIITMANAFEVSLVFTPDTLNIFL